MKEKNPDLIKTLFKHVYKLYKLLILKQDGHFSWVNAVSTEWKAIAELWSKPEKPSVFFIEHLFHGEWYISRYYSKDFYTSREIAENYVKTITKNNDYLLPLRVQGYARVLEVEK